MDGGGQTYGFCVAAKQASCILLPAGFASLGDQFVGSSGNWRMDMWQLTRATRMFPFAKAYGASANAQVLFWLSVCVDNFPKGYLLVNDLDQCQ